MNPETTDTTEEHDDELLYAEDSKGNRIPDSNIGLLASTPTLLEFKALGETHRVEVRYDAVSYDARRKPGQIAQKMSAEAGIANAGDDLEIALDVDRQILESPQFQIARAELALLATTRDSKGRSRVSIPMLRGPRTPSAVADMVLGKTGDETEMVYARVYVATVCDAVSRFFGS